MTGERIAIPEAMTVPQKRFAQVKFSLAKSANMDQCGRRIYPKTTSASERSESDVMATKISSLASRVSQLTHSDEFNSLEVRSWEGGKRSIRSTHEGDNERAPATTLNFFNRQ